MQITNEYVFDLVSTISARIVHQYEHLLYYAKSPHSWALPNEWQRICEKFPAIIRNKVKTTHATCSTATINSATTNPTTITTAPYSYPNLKACSTSLTLRVACNTAAHSSITTTTTSVTTTNTIPTTTTSTCNNKTIINEVDSISSTASTITTTTPTASVTNTNNVHNNLSISFKNINNINNNNIEVFHHESNTNEKFSEQSACVPATTTNLFKLNPPYGGSLSLNIKRKGFFNRLTYSIDEDGYEALMKTPSPGNEQLPPPPSLLTQSAITSHQNAPMTATSTSVNVTGGSGRLNNIHINRSLASIRTGPMTSSPSTMSSSVVPLTESFTPHEANTRQKLLNKQIKIISDIMVESSKTGGNSKSSESLKVVATNDQKSVNDLNEDDDTDVQFIAVSTAANSTLTEEADTMKPQIHTPTTRPKLSYEYRSYSTCD